MKNLLSSVSLSALALCFTIQFANAIKTTRDEDENKSIINRQRKEPEISNFSIFGIPEEAQVNIIWQLRHDLDILIPKSSVSQLWNHFINNKMLGRNLEFSTIPDQDAQRDIRCLFDSLIRLDLKENTKLTDGGLAYLPHIMALDLSNGPDTDDSKNLITNRGLINLNNLRYLKLHNNLKITDDTLKNLTTLHFLSLDYDLCSEYRNFNPITDNSIQELKNLTTLILNHHCVSITAKGLEPLSNLSSLSLFHNTEIEDGDIKNLSNLTFLSLIADFEYESSITNEGISKLTKLKTLRVHNIDDITGEGFKGFINLTSLSLRMVNDITDDLLKRFTNLTYLRLMDVEEKITDNGIKDLTKLTTLIVTSYTGMETPSFTGFGIGHLNNLTTLDLELREEFSDDEIFPLVHLPYLSHLNLRFERNKRITDEGLKPLKSIPHLCLDISFNDFITDQEIQHFTNIFKLKINDNIKLRGLEDLKNIPCLKGYVEGGSAYLKINGQYTSDAEQYLNITDKFLNFEE